MIRWLLLLTALVPAAAAARVLTVGPGGSYALPSAAAHAARDSDTILIEPGQYYDCAIWTGNHLVIAGTGPGVVITDTTCQGKGLFVVIGHDTTIRDLTLARARVPDRNGAGIRLEGQGLRVQHVQFINDQVGLLAAAAGSGEIRISGSRFERGGVGGPRPTFAVLVGAVARLRIRDSSFAGVNGGQIKSMATRTELIANHIETGPDPAAAAIFATGGTLILRDNVFVVGPPAPRLAAAVLAQGRGVFGRGALVARGNRMLNPTATPMALLLNWTGSEPDLQANTVGPTDRTVSAAGLWRHRAASLYHGTKHDLRAAAGWLKRGLMGLAG